ncbi:hypothetical protein LINPERHAP1_LOCUS27796, partial [Linum perenne]
PPPPASRKAPATPIPPPPASQKAPATQIPPIPPHPANPVPTPLWEQWRFAIKQYNRRYSQAWGTTILAGVSFFALGWIIKGGNPLPSFISDHYNNSKPRLNDGASLMPAEICRFRY